MPEQPDDPATPDAPDAPATPTRSSAAGWKLYLIPAIVCALLGGWLVVSSLGDTDEVTATEPTQPTAVSTSGPDDPEASPSPTTPVDEQETPATTSGQESGDQTTTSATTTTAAKPTEDRAEDLEPGITPERIIIPTIGVDAPVGGLSLAGPAPEVPTNFDDAGWYTQTVRPGDLGPAVIAGHIDSKTGPAVFFKLDQLAQGDLIQIQGDQGDDRSFEVIDSGQYLKEQLPDEVFAFGQREPELRLITCGGVFDRESGHYQDNYVIYAQAIDA